MNRLFVTGMGRSGTTLLDKLLSSHVKAEILSQPFPMLFTELKKGFLNKIEQDKYFVLNDSFIDHDYKLDDFLSFMDEYRFGQQQLNTIFDKMANYSGQLTKIQYNDMRCTQCGFLEVYDYLLKSNLYKKNVSYFGSKEIMCEEFIPLFLRNKTKVIVIVRDPRDVVASINYPQKNKYLGDKKPLLFILRAWRRSVSYVNFFIKNKDFLFLRYEDLVSDTDNTLNNITSFLSVAPFDKRHFVEGIYDRCGNLWKANSSSASETSLISSASVGGYRNSLTREEINYIESTCKTEMQAMNYHFTTVPNKEIIKTFTDNDVADSEHLDKSFSSLPENVLAELEHFESTPLISKSQKKGINK